MIKELLEATPSKNKVFRDGRKQILWKCPSGFRATHDGGDSAKDKPKCVKMLPDEIRKLAKVAKKRARLSKPSRKGAAKKRARTNRRRSAVIR